jgi:enoyl-CoA hydratase
VEFKTIKHTLNNGVVIISLNRPHVLNAMNSLMWSELEQVLNLAASNPEARVLIFTGTGRAFSTGADLKESPNRTRDQYREYLCNLQRISRIIMDFPKPTIAAINGYALGSGYELALACDLRIAARDARIGSPEVKVSSSVTGGATRLLTDLVGPGKAKELLFTAEYINGEEAEKTGLVNRVVSAAMLMKEAVSLAEKISPNSLLSMRGIKKAINMSREVSLTALMDYETEACLNAVFSEERKEKITTFKTRKKTATSNRVKKKNALDIKN